MSDLIDLATKEDSKDKIYTGRFLGFIKDDEFNALIQNTDKVAAKLESKITQPLMKIIGKFDNMVGYRLIMTVKEVDGKSTLKKFLYITEPLDLVIEVSGNATNGAKKVMLQSKENEITLQEKK